MKKVIIILCCVICASVAYAQGSAVFKKYADNNEVTTVYISKSMLGMVSGIGAVGAVGGMNFEGLSTNLTSLQVLTCENIGLIPEIRKSFNQAVEKYELLMQVNDEGEKTNIYSCEKEILMLVEEEDEFTAILFTGDFKKSDLKKIMSK